MSGAAIRPVLFDLLCASPTPVALDTLKLERLRELRAAIDALRQEQATRDPLLTWVLAQQETGISRPD